MNKAAIVILSLLTYGNVVNAQESFLKLDSIVVLSDTLYRSVSYSYFTSNDTVSINLAKDQIVKVRSASLQLFSLGQMEFDYSKSISNFGILCNNNIILDASAVIDKTIHGNGSGFPINLNYFQSKYLAINSQPDIFFTNDLVFQITCSGTTSASSTETYRIELIYYSYE